MTPGIRPGGHPLVWYVASSRPDIEAHQVHLGAYRGNGCCTCEHFEYRLRAEMEHAAPPPSDETRCKHIQQARAALLDETIERLSASTQNPNSDDHDHENAYVRRRPPKASAASLKR